MMVWRMMGMGPLVRQYNNGCVKGVRGYLPLVGSVNLTDGWGRPNTR